MSAWVPLAREAADALAVGDANARKRWVTKHVAIWMNIERWARAAEAAWERGEPQPPLRSQDFFQGCRGGVEYVGFVERAVKQISGASSIRTYDDGEGMHVMASGCFAVYPLRCDEPAGFEVSIQIDYCKTADMEGMLAKIETMIGDRMVGKNTAYRLLANACQYKWARMMSTVPQFQVVPFRSAYPSVVRAFLEFVSGVPPGGQWVGFGYVYERPECVWAFSPFPARDGSMWTLMVAVANSGRSSIAVIADALRDNGLYSLVNLVNFVALDGSAPFVWDMECSRFLRENPERRAQFTRAVCMLRYPDSDRVDTVSAGCCNVYWRGPPERFERVVVELERSAFRVYVVDRARSAWHRQVRPEATGDAETRYADSHPLPPPDVQRGPARVLARLARVMLAGA
jgi:hypothetical protein